MARIICCEKCGINLGEIRDATLRTIMNFILLGVDIDEIGAQG